MTEKDNNPGYSVMLNHKRTSTEESFNKFLGLSAHTICKWCSKPVAHQASGDSYIHLDSNGIPIPLGRGCRSASYDESAPYEGCLRDQTLKKHWRATPRKKNGGFESPLAAEVFDALQDRETDKAATAAAWVSENESEFWDRYAGPLLDRLEETQG